MAASVGGHTPRGGRRTVGAPTASTGPGSGVSGGAQRQLSRTNRTKKNPAKRPKKNKGGRPVGSVKPILITPQQIADAAEAGCTLDEIATLAGISHDVLSRRFKQELAFGKALRRKTLREVQYQQAKSGNGTMLVWLGKNELGQTDRGENDIEFTYDLNNLSREELERFAAGQPLKKILAGRERITA